MLYKEYNILSSISGPQTILETFVPLPGPTPAPSACEVMGRQDVTLVQLVIIVIIKFRYCEISYFDCCFCKLPILRNSIIKSFYAHTCFDTTRIILWLQKHDRQFLCATSCILVRRRGYYPAVVALKVDLFRVTSLSGSFASLLTLC